jgi:hypothetical protein
MKFSAIAVFTAALVLAGCAATGPKMTEMQASMPTLKADQGRVFFFRQSSMMGAALQPSINLDGNIVGESKPGGFFYVDTAVGSHVAMTSTEVSNKLSFVLAPGEVKYVRTAPSMGLMVGHITPTLVGADEAKQEIATLSYTGGTAVK